MAFHFEALILPAPPGSPDATPLEEIEPMNVISRPADLAVTSGPLPASRKVHIAGKVHPGIRVAMREIEVAGGKEPPVMVYDTSGPYTDPTVKTDIGLGLAPLRTPWIVARGDVEEIAG